MLGWLWRLTVNHEAILNVHQRREVTPTRSRRVGRTGGHRLARALGIRHTPHEALLCLDHDLSYPAIELGAAARSMHVSPDDRSPSRRTGTAVSLHAFVDESDRSGYLIAAAVLLPGDLATARKTISQYVLPGQYRIHMVKESDSRRRQIISALCDLGLEVVLYDGSEHRAGKAARQACLERLVADLAERKAQRLVLERDDGMVDLDKRVLFQAVTRAGCRETLSYVHQRAREESLLSIPDVVAWSWTRSAEWRRRVDPMVTAIRKV